MAISENDPTEQSNEDMEEDNKLRQEYKTLIEQLKEKLERMREADDAESRKNVDNIIDISPSGDFNEDGGSDTNRRINGRVVFNNEEYDATRKTHLMKKKNQLSLPLETQLPMQLESNGRSFPSPEDKTEQNVDEKEEAFSPSLIEARFVNAPVMYLRMLVAGMRTEYEELAETETVVEGFGTRMPVIEKLDFNPIPNGRVNFQYCRYRRLRSEIHVYYDGENWSQRELAQQFPA